MSDEDDVIKYRLDYTPAAALPTARLAELIGWQRLLNQLGLVGRDPARYEGYAYGNLSLRLAEGGFVISATQSADTVDPEPDDYAQVTAWDSAANLVIARGPAEPSSESLTHAALYDADPAIGCILHVHAPDIWQQRERLGLASTNPAVAYGTPAMADEVGHLYHQHGFNGHGVLAMAGHEDGVLSFGHDPDEAGWEMLRLLRRALSPG